MGEKGGNYRRSSHGQTPEHTGDANGRNTSRSRASGSSRTERREVSDKRTEKSYLRERQTDQFRSVGEALERKTFVVNMPPGYTITS